MQGVDHLLSQLSYIPPTLFLSEVSYVEFLDRVHVSEKKLRAQGLWEVHHPWLNLLIPRSEIHDFAEVVFGHILKDTSNGPILIYPVNQTRYIYLSIYLSGLSCQTRRFLSMHIWIHFFERYKSNYKSIKLILIIVLTYLDIFGYNYCHI